MGRALAVARERAESGDWVEGEMQCIECHRPMRTRMIENPHGPGVVTPGSWYEWFTIGANDPSPYVPLSICPCCSFPNISGCPHREVQATYADIDAGLTALLVRKIERSPVVAWNTTPDHPMFMPLWGPAGGPMVPVHPEALCSWGEVWASDDAGKLVVVDFIPQGSCGRPQCQPVSA